MKFNGVCSYKRALFLSTPENIAGVPQNYGHLTLSMVQLTGLTDARLNLSTTDPEVFRGFVEGAEYEVEVIIKRKEKGE